MTNTSGVSQQHEAPPTNVHYWFRVENKKGGVTNEQGKDHSDSYFRDLFFDVRLDIAGAETFRPRTFIIAWFRIYITNIFL